MTQASWSGRAGGSDLRWAVKGGPDGTDVVEIGANAVDLKRELLRGAITLHCSRKAGGCGGKLNVIVGRGRVHHFRHLPGTDCFVTGLSDHATADRYTHLRIQRALVEWLAGQGLESSIEQAVGPGSRMDVLLAQKRHALEVHLSRMAEAAWLERDERYRGQVDGVWWLNGMANDAVVDHLRERDGFAYLVKVTVAGVVELGVADCDGEQRWASLSEWVMTEDGPAGPLVDQAHRMLEQRQVEAEERERREREGARERLRREAAEQERRRPKSERHRHETPARARPSAESPFVYQAPTFPTYPGYQDWYDAQDWSWTAGMSEKLAFAAVAGAYYTTVLAVRGPVSLLVRIIGDQEGKALQALVDRGLIHLEPISATSSRWVRS
jgi:hypothetical protein